MDTTPVAGVDELDEHLDQLLQDADLPLNAKLFDNAQLQLTENNIAPLIPRLLPRLVAILEGDGDRDPAVLAGLCTRLLGPVTYAQALSLAPPEALSRALRAPAPSVNVLAMTVLGKARRSPRDVARLAVDTPDLVADFVARWLLSPHAAVGAEGRRVLGDLLDVDCPLQPSPPGTVRAGIVRRRSPGTGALWRLVFGDPAVYGLLLDICSGRHPDAPESASGPGASNSQLSLAQGRLLDILPRLAALDFSAVASSALPAARPTHATNGSGGAASPPSPSSSDSDDGNNNDGLLQFAALHMVDRRRDALLRLNLVGFFEALVSLMRVTERSAYKVETMRALLRQATAADEAGAEERDVGGGRLRDVLQSLPDRTVPEEADELRAWLHEVLPPEPAARAMPLR